jgi:hypothetical protein
MSFSKTVSVFAALASIFAAGAAGFKLSQDSQQQETQPKTQDISIFEKKIADLEKEVEQAKTQAVNTKVFEPVNLPQPVITNSTPPPPPPVPSTTQP